MKTPKLSTFGEVVYNYADAPRHERGDMGRGKPKVARVYSVYRIEDGIAFCQSRNAWGEIFDERIRLNTLQPYTSRKQS